MLNWVKGKIPFKDSVPRNEREEEEAARKDEDRQYKEDAKAQKRFSREHGKRQRARERELQKEREGKGKMYMKGSFMVVGGGGA